ncbi:GNAT family N-acetyltransferase [Kutzneria albida]|uniref:N-acetyltransferase domain-containing protein n=1 Tax=Kutzneria albida DSM 43870 TaxID=1449976 RepID=W5W3J0_9PSEU|nr:GNAT family N-acetyltransferase [Kutzneria albida]AHH95345.1 hypothetical protein KALB_1975 [Kutzneria albida DSM 43870]
MSWAVRPAVADDADELVRLREHMFAAMGVDLADTSWRQPCVDHFARKLGGADFVCLVIDVPEGQGLACAALAQLRRGVPGPGNPTGVSAHISNVCTDPQWRRHGMARAVMVALLAELDAREVPALDLHATEDGRGLYESLGFGPRGGGVELSRSVGALVAPSPRDGAVHPVQPGSR